MKKQFTKALAVLLTLCMLAGMMILPTGATEPETETAIEPDTSWFKGYVVEKDTTDPQTYEISTAAQLLGFAKIAHFYDFAGDTVKLTADIDLNPGWDATTTIADDGTVTLANAPANVWTAIPVFKGTLDGNGHTISGIYSASEFTVPASSNRYVGGFINQLVNGTVKNLIVKNSLATFTSEGGSGTSKIRTSGFISRVVDANLQNVYVDIDAWMTGFNYHYSFGGIVCSIETEASDNNYVGKLENWVYAGDCGRIIDGKHNVDGGQTENINFGFIIGANAKTATKAVVDNISFIGSVYKPAGKLWCWDDGPFAYNSGANTNIANDNNTLYHNIDGMNNATYDNGSVSQLTSVAWGNNGSKLAELKGEQYKNDTYEQAGFKLITIENGAGVTDPIMLPGTVVDMLNLSEFVQDTESENTKIGAATDWYGTTIPQTYYLYTPEQLFGFEEVAQIYDFAGDTVKLMADIDLNAGWDATTTIADDGTVTLANAPANVWTAIPVFKGTLDGNGHTISGIYSASEFTVPASSNRYVGGFINQLVNGTVKNLIVKNSLATFTSEGGSGTSKIRTSGFISRVVDANLQNVYVDIDAWMTGFNYHYSFGGIVCSIETEASDNNYVGKLENWVYAGDCGRIIDGKHNVDGGQTENINFGFIIGANAKTATKAVVDNISFIGSVYKPAGKLWCWDDGPFAYNSGANTNIANDNNTLYHNIDGMNNATYDNGSVSQLTSVAWGNNGSKLAELKGEQYKNDTYEQAGFKLITIENGAGVTDPIMLPGAVVDMLTKNTSNLYLQKSADGSKVRFVGVVNISEEEFENFSALGFDISMTYDGKTYTNTFTTTTVYKTLTANGTPVSASEYGGTYFYAIEITGLDTADSDVVFDVDGITIHTGESTKNVYGSATVTFTPAA